jgi:hypothetical protein
MALQATDPKLERSAILFQSHYSSNTELPPHKTFFKDNKKNTYIHTDNLRFITLAEAYQKFL